jgi:putative ATP-binding cassette transporter
MFVPRQPYVPLGTLRAALAYPSPETAFKDEELAAMLQKAGLDRLSSSLNQTARWDKELTDDEQQCLVLTRVLLHKPRLVVIDEALDPLDDDARNRVLRLLNDELKEAGIINIGRPETHFFTRVLHLVKDPQGRCFLPDLRVAYSSAA